FLITLSRSACNLRTNYGPSVGRSIQGGPMADSLACHLRRLNRWFPATIAGVVGAAALGGSGTALAQDNAEAGGLEEVTVTARFRQENLQQTPLAISAIAGEVLEQRNLVTVTDLDNFVPNTVIAP